MGIIKQKTLNNGVTINYWRIQTIEHKPKDGTTVVLGGYVSKSVSDSVGDQGIVATVAFYELSIHKDDFIDSNPYEKAYELIMATDEFAGSMAG